MNELINEKAPQQYHLCPTGKEPSLEGGPSSRAFESILLENIAPLVEEGGSTLSIVDNPVNIVEVSLLLAVQCVCRAVNMEEPETKPLHKCFLLHTPGSTSAL